MRCPNCGKVYPASEKMCKTCEEILVSEAVYSNRLSNARRAANSNIPKCPICGSTNLKKLSFTNKAVSIGVFGLLSNKINKTWECKNCKSTF